MLILFGAGEAFAAGEDRWLFRDLAIDSPEVDLIYPISSTNDPSVPGGGSVDLNPENIQTNVVYDPVTNTYIFTQTLPDGTNVVPPSSMTFEQYIQYQNQQSNRQYWQEKVNEQVDDARGKEADIPEFDNNITEESLIKIPGSDFITIKPQGSAELKFGINISRTDNPVLPVKQRRITTFDFDQQIQMNLTGKIGDFMKIGFNYNTEATFDFENQLKLNYAGDEDEIIEVLEAGNVSMPLNSSLIQGSQSLFGIKSKLRFGRLSVTTILSQDRGQKKEIEVSGGAQVQEFEIEVDNYEENRHFFVGYHFYDEYDESMSTLPVPSSQIQIQRMEVWVTNRTNTYTDTRNILAFTDLGEAKTANLQNPAYANSSQSIPDNNHNSLYNQLNGNSSIRNYVNASTVLTGSFGMQQSVDFEKVENARLLSENEYSFNSLLGFISLNQSLNNDEVLAVAYQYTYKGKTYQVGEFSTDGVGGQSALYLKLLKATVRNPKNKLWDLMMKNVYSLGAYQIDPSNFRLDVWYNNPSTGVDVNYIPQAGTDNIRLLIQMLKLDQLNQQQARYSDGMFDFLPVRASNGKVTTVGTINPQNGRLYFTTKEPFGTTLEQSLLNAGVSQSVADKVVFPQLYDSTKTAAQQIPELNRFTIKGSYQSSVSSEISLNALNIPQGSVQVTAGGRLLTEGSDYTVDYNLGRVRILNDGILSSGTPVKIQMESNSLFTIQQKSLIGTHLDYKISKDAQVGATLMRLTEKPLTQKVNVGDEPIANTMLGLDGSFKKDVPFLTKLVDMIPFIDTKQMSTINFSGEVAALLPGHNKAIGKTGNSFIDNFEGSQSSIDIRSFNTWVHASVPQGQPDLFPEASLSNNLEYGYNRAKIAWYVIDPLFFNNNNLTPDHIRNSEMQVDHRMRQVLVNEVFPNKQLATGSLNNIPVLDLAYYPSERGPYNFDTQNVDPTSGEFTNPEDRWAGIMRTITINDFEAANIAYIQFWMMDPFSENHPNGSNEDSPNTTGGDLYFNLGNISEDILKDGRKSFENGIPADGPDGSGQYTNGDVVETAWGWMPTTQVVVTAFDNNLDSRLNQDVGLDGLRNDLEADFFSDYLNSLSVDPAIRALIEEDPSNDNYRYFRDDRWDAEEADILTRYKLYNNPDGNSPTSEISATINADGYSTSATTLPNIEDINGDNNLNETEAYFQYKVSLRPQNMEVGTNFIVDRIEGEDDKSGKKVMWYQFRIPISEFSSKINGIQDFRAIRFIRMFMTGWSQEAVLRFARLELVRGEWRPYLGEMLTPGEYIQGEESSTTFNVTAVNLEDNGKKLPINYNLPPNVNRQINYQTANLAQQNEQSLVLDVCGLRDGDARAAYRNVQFDIRNYNKIEMYVHAESGTMNEDDLEDDDITVFVRLGTDFNQNYYEYEMPVKVSEWYNNTQESIWPVENNMVIDLNVLKDLKKERNRVNFSIFERYTKSDSTASDRNVTVVGNPNLQAMKTIMIGVRNPKKDDPYNQWQPDDGLEKCAEVWVNELRLSDFNESPGWATIGRMTAQLADFADVSVAGNYSSPGWGSIEKSVSERQQEHIYGFDASTTVQLGNFFGDRVGLRLPVYLGYSRNVIRPLYDPLNPDLILVRDTSMENSEWDEYLNNSIDLTERRAINFTNVSVSPKKKDGSSPKPHFYNLSNLSLNLSYNEVNKKDINTRYNNTKNYLAGFNYSFSKSPRPWEPFKGINFIRKSKWLKLVKDFNFYLAPKQIGFKTTLNRTYNEYATRYNFIGGENLEFPQFNKTFNWDRDYTVKYDLTKSLNFDFTAKNRSFVNEPFGKVDYGMFGYQDELKQDTAWKSIKSFGENMNYNHNFNVSYKWPFSKFPLTEWIALTTRYTGSFDWTREPLAMDSIGHIVQNSRQISWNGKLTMSKLYNKVPYLKKVNDKYSKGKSPFGKSKQVGPKTDGEADNGKEDNDDDDKKDKKDKKSKKDDDKDGFNIIEQFARVLMSLDNVTATYSTTDGILLPGYAQRTTILGLSPTGNSIANTPYEFIAGGNQEYDMFGRPTNQGVNSFGITAYNNGWLTDTSFIAILPTMYQVNHAEKANFKATLKPFNGLKIDLDANFNLSENTNSTLGFNDEGEFDLLNPQFTGMFSKSVVTWRTAFVKEQGDENSLFNTTFANMLALRPEMSHVVSNEVISDEFNFDHISEDSISSGGGYADGFSGLQQNVLIGAFYAAYTGNDVSSKSVVDLAKGTFNRMPLPNWRITFDGLTNLGFVKKLFKRVSFNHAYKSNFNIAGYTTNLSYNNDEAVVDLNGNVIAQRQIMQVSISEQFAPLLGVDVTLKNDLTAKFEFKKDRNIGLGLANAQVTEIKGTELTIGSGYTWRNIKFPIKVNKKTIANDLIMRLDISMRDNKTIIRKIAEEINQPTAGQKIISIKFSASYQLTDKFQLRAYFDRVVNKPFISTSYPTANTNSGIALRFQL
ncbi:MAG: cell surface protein SprA [Flavobacteriales bacterium]|nr:cell surface protein SprA [Flavobacteriales bacterium]MCB9198446.1 cell surface protein SprA [Flavobacteriales bacterium]